MSGAAQLRTDGKRDTGMEHVRCAQCRNPIRGRQAFVTHARSGLSFHADCWWDLHQRVQADYVVTVASDGVEGLIRPYSRGQEVAWLPTVAVEATSALDQPA